MLVAEFRSQCSIDDVTLDAWISAGWLRPQGERPNCEFTEVDVARARLIADLRADLGLNDDAVPVVLELIDQIHGLRRAMRILLERSGP